MVKPRLLLSQDIFRSIDPYTIALYVNIIRGKVSVQGLSINEINMCRTILKFTTSTSTTCGTGDSCKCPVGFCRVQILEREIELAETTNGGNDLPLCVYNTL
jgi:hypothetical protein